MKAQRVIVGLLVVVMVLALSGCSGGSDSALKDSAADEESQAEQTEDVDSASTADEEEPQEEAVPAKPSADEIIAVKILSGGLKNDQYGYPYLSFDYEYTAVGLEKPARAIKGVLLLQDLFGETKVSVGATIDEGMQPGGTVLHEGYGWDYNEYMEDDKWAATTAVENMKAVFEVESIIYEDGTQEDF